MWPSRDFVLSAVDTTPLIQPTTTTYNANNQQTMFGTSTETYDLNGNLTTITNALNKITTIMVNPQDQPLAVKDPLNRTTTRMLDAADRLRCQQQSAHRHRCQEPADGVCLFAVFFLV